jgi:hypothetical protein
VILSVAWSFAADKSIFLGRFLLLLVCFSWPVIVTIWMIHPQGTGKFFIAYAIAYIFMGVIGVIRNQEFSFAQLFVLWILMNGPVTLFLLFITSRNIRSIGPLVFAFLLTAFTGAYVIIDIFSKSEGLMYLSSVIGSQLGVNAVMIFTFFILTGLVLFAPLGWLFLRWIGKRYQSKKMSEQSLSLDTLWIIFGFFQSFALISDNFKLAFTGIVAFVALKITIWMTRRLLYGKTPNIPSDHVLMLLRVFSLGKKSESLFDATTRNWLQIGSMCMLSGPDLATSTLEPHEFYDFIGGRLSRQFIHDENDLEHKLSEIDLLPDPDGRYRVNEFFCMANTWQITMQKLAGKCSAVLMDLRSYSGIHEGSTFELIHLLNSFPVKKIVLLTDQSTDSVFLKTTVNSILGNPGNLSINAGLKAGDLQIVDFRENDQAEMKKLHELLFSI